MNNSVLDNLILDNLLYNDDVKTSYPYSFQSKTNMKLINLQQIALFDERLSEFKNYGIIRSGAYSKSLYNFVYIYATAINNEVIISLKTKPGNTYKVILFITCFAIENIKTIDIYNDSSNKKSLINQVNSSYVNYISTFFENKDDTIYIKFQFKDAAKKNQQNRIFLCKKIICENVNSNNYNLIVKNNLLFSEKKYNKFDYIIGIAVWGREEILEKILHLINSFKLPFKLGIVLVYSRKSDYNRFSKYNNVFYHYSPNSPLGSKWLSVIYYSQLYNPDMLMILGSDDMVSRKYLIDSYMKIKEGNDIYACNKWYMYDETNNNLYKSTYKIKRLLGAGRVLSSKFLRKCNFKIYDPVINKSLDSLLLRTITKHHPQFLKSIHITDKIGILLYKGHWECFNKAKVLINAKSLNTIKLENNITDILNEFNIKEKKLTPPRLPPNTIPSNFKSLIYNKKKTKSKRNTYILN
jgi:hypothetical protein